MTQMLIPAPQAAPNAWSLLLVATRAIIGDARRISLVGDDLEGFIPANGQRARLILRTHNGVLTRDYPIHGFDADELRLDLTASVADDPAMTQWMQTAEIGDPVIAEMLDADGTIVEAEPLGPA
jgi:NADPH-dependent ferric siderophore reductase